MSMPGLMFCQPDLPFTVLKAAAGAQQAGATRLDGTPTERLIAIVPQETAEQLSPTALEGITIYAPLSAGQFKVGGV